MTSPWHQGQWLAMDTETSGIDSATDRIVSAALIYLHHGQPPVTYTWTVNPGIDVPQAAIDVHGLTNEMLREHGQDPKTALDEIAEGISHVLAKGLPCVGYNVPFDLTMLGYELDRHGLPSLEERIGGPVAPVLDGLVLDKHCDKYRKGSRKLVDVARHYGVPLSDDDAHGAAADAMAAARVVYAIAQRYPIDLSLSDLHLAQMGWAAEQASSFRDYRKKQGKPFEDIDGTWPIRRVDK